jgi:hypothetical protein
MKSTLLACMSLLASLTAAESGDPNLAPIEGFETASPFTANPDGGTPASVELKAEAAHAGKSGVQLTYKNVASGYGNLQMPFELYGSEECIGFWVKKLSAAKGAVMHLWLIEGDGDAWVSPQIKIAEFGDGWKRVEVKLKDMSHDPRGDKFPAIDKAQKLLIGCNYADLAVHIDDLFATGPGVLAKRTAGASGMIDIESKNVVCKKFLGFGAEWDPQFWTNGSIGPTGDIKPPEVTEADWDIMLARIRFMKLPLVRMMMMARWCTEDCVTFDFETKRMQSMYRHLDVCEKEGIDVILTDWGCYNWVKVPTVTGVHDPKYAQAIGTYLDHLMNKKKYTCIKYFVLVNEPNLDTDSTWDSWKAGAENVGKQLVARKFSDRIAFLGSDFGIVLRSPDSPANDWHYRAVDQLQTVLDGYDIHVYTAQAQVIAGQVQGYFTKMWDYARTKDAKGKDKPMIVGEAGVISDGFSASTNPRHEEFAYGIDIADYAVQAASAGSAAVSAWMLDDNCISGFTWGMCRDKAHGMGTKPWFYPWSLLCRTIRPGSAIYRLDSKRVRALAAKLPDNKGWTFVVINRAATDVTSALRLADAGAISLWRYEYTPKLALADASGSPKPVGETKGDLGAGINVSLPANSLVVLTSVAP